MRYGQTHKQETRSKVLTVAAKALREKGPDGLGVAEVMNEAGLTHGGFYAHFPSKEAFLTESLNEVFAQLTERIRRVTEGLPPREALNAYIDHYVSRSHRDHASMGCPLPALNSELPRQSESFRKAFDAGVKRLIDQFAQWISDAGIVNSETLAVSTVSAMAGAVALSRAVSDRSLSNELLESARAGIKARLGLVEAKDSRP
jgi:TetR/AcrR family transcriptional regulator, transcriptional repressor for nem operon